MHLSLGLHIHALPMHDGWELNLLTNFTWNGRAQEALFLKEISTWSVRVVLSLLEDITVHPNRKKGGHVSPNPVKVMHHPLHHNGTMCSAFACGIYACPCHDQEATLSLYSLSVWRDDVITMVSGSLLQPGRPGLWLWTCHASCRLQAKIYRQTVAIFHSQQGVIAPAT